MTRQPRRLAYAVVAVLALLVAVGRGHADAGAVATPEPLSSYSTPPPLSATATPKPTGLVVRYAGRLLDVRRGFVFFTTGDGFRLDPSAKIVDAKSGGPTKLQATTGTYARATFDESSGNVVELALSSNPLPNEASFDQIARFAIALSTPYPNPDLNTNKEGFNGMPVLVVFTAEVPPKTPFTDSVYLATDVSGWSATAIKMDRIDALHYRVARDFNSGTHFFYRYTRGSWSSAERGQDGLDVKPRELLVRNLDVQRVANVVYHWGDENQFQPDLGQPAPTPYNPVPFNLPPRK
ncbi:MAG: hypothetical protein ACLPYS_15380 [Vulcanimicrobiaceae bacterium]